MSSKRFIFDKENKRINEVKRGLMNELKAMDLSKPKIVMIGDYAKDKTAEQRSWFHALCKILGDETGYTLDEVKELVKKDILSTKIVKIGGISKEVTKSSEKAKRDEYSELIDGIYRIGAEAGVVLPNPRRFD